MSGLDESRLVLTPKGAARTGDVLAFVQEDGAWLVLLIERGGDPDKGRLALPGGFMERGEDARPGITAARELEEETGLSVTPPPQSYDVERSPGVVRDQLCWVKTYDARDRDIRRWTSAEVYGVVLSSRPHVAGADDAASAAFYPLAPLLERIEAAQAAGDRVCAFDHDAAIVDTVSMFRSYGTFD